MTSVASKNGSQEIYYMVSLIYIFLYVDGKVYLNPTPNVLPHCDILLWKLLVPEALRISLIESAHCPPTSAHLGITKTTEIIRRLYHWPSLSSDVKNFINGCVECKSNKAMTTQCNPPLNTLPITFRPWQRVYLDFLGPYPRTKNGNTSIIIAVDHFSKFVLTKALRRATAAEVCQFLENQIFLVFGVPEVIVTDNGRQFEAQAVQDLCRKYGVRHIHTAKYSPQANASERVNRTLLASLRAYIKEDHRVWDINLPSITHALRNCVHGSTGQSPHFLVFGQHSILHGSAYELLKTIYEFTGTEISIEDKPNQLYQIYGKVKQNLIEAAHKNNSRYNLRGRVPNLKVGQIVYVRNFTQSKAADQYAAKLAKKYVPGVIVRLVGRVTCEIADKQGKSMGIYHVKDLKT